ncbi:MAG: DUF1207 domain-containing protein [Pirellulales bacterium]
MNRHGPWLLAGLLVSATCSPMAAAGPHLWRKPGHVRPWTITGGDEVVYADGVYVDLDEDRLTAVSWASDLDGPSDDTTWPRGDPSLSVEPLWGDGAYDKAAGYSTSDLFTLQLLPDGLIYRSYMAGAKESRISGTPFYERDGGWLLDVTLGGRVGILRYGTTDGQWPQGWQLDLEGAAFPRLALANSWDMESADFRFGLPLTWGRGNRQLKLAYYHLSAHLGDERALREPGQLDQRINYSRDVIVVGYSIFPHPNWRLYGEAGWAFYTDGGSETWEFQFGTELTVPYDSYLRGSPFVAINVNLRQEVDYGGNLTMQAGWLWQGDSGHRLRVGLHLLAGKSNQYQFFNRNEQQIGFGTWYDY